MTRRGLRPLLTVLAFGLVSGCGGGPGKPPRTAPGEVIFGVYRGRLVDAEGKRSSFRAWVWAERPARIHAEILPPLGGPAWILDAGEGRLALIDVGEGICWLGAETPGLLRRWWGVPRDVQGLVDGILESREPGEAFPGRIEFERGSLGSLVLERTGYRVAPRGTLGSASPPPGMDVRPLAELESGAFDAAPEERGDP